MVTATKRITEEGFNDVELFVHAEIGDAGVLLCQADVGPDWFMVRWSRAGTVSMCHADELDAAEA